MSRSSKSGRADDAAITQFCAVTGATTKDAKQYLDKYKRTDIAIDAYYKNPQTVRRADAPSTSKLTALFEKYKDPTGDEITVDGTIRLCEDLGVNPEDVVMLSVAYELKSPKVGEWNKKGWIEGWKNIGCDSTPTMKSALLRLRDRLGSDPQYFNQVYNHTFDFARSEGQRSLAVDTAQAFWGLLIPHGLQGGALAHASSRDFDDDDDMGEEEGWKDEYTSWWFEFLDERGGKGVSKDTWAMFLEFVRSIDANFKKYDPESAWPSTIDDFVEWAKKRLAVGNA